MILALSVLILLLGLTSKLYASTTKALRVALFETVTALSTTGFSTVSLKGGTVLAG